MTAKPFPARLEKPAWLVYAGTFYEASKREDTWIGRLFLVALVLVMGVAGIMWLHVLASWSAP